LTKTVACRYLKNVHQEILLPVNETPKKLENFLRRRFPIGYVRKLFRKNGVRINGKRAKPDAIVRPGDRLQIYIPFEKQQLKAAAQKVSTVRELETIFEDEEILVLNKPAGLAVQPGQEILKRHTVIGMLESRYRPRGVLPKLVHRLDKETSGLLLVAKGEDAAMELRECFEAGRVHKEYLCLVAGRLPRDEGTIDFPLPGRDGKAVSALTHFKVAKRFSATTLVRVRIETGRRHQIRLHFARLGYPVVMDSQHGDFAFNRIFRKNYGLKRQFLHAAKIAFEYGGKKKVWIAPVPEDLKRTLTALQSGLPRREEV
jgi:23S rRNA pseudouridine955/2504/2580 synthase